VGLIFGASGRHATTARQQAERDAAQGNRELELLHRREAELHQRAAAREVEVAALQREHASRLQDSSDQQ